MCVAKAGSRLRHLHIPATVLHTLRDSDDSVSIALDDGRVFTGDLPNPNYVDPERADLAAAGWQDIVPAGARWFYPAHGPFDQS